MEGHSLHEVVKRTEIDLPQYLKPIYGDKIKDPDVLDQRRSAWHTAVYDNNEVSDHHEWNDKTHNNFVDRNARAVILTTLSPHASAVEAYHEIPANPFDTLATPEQEGAIVISGIPFHSLFEGDNPSTVDDDAVRQHIDSLAYNIRDPEVIHNLTKVKMFVGERLPTEAFSYGSSILPWLIKVHPLIFVSLTGIRSGLTLRKLVRNGLDPLSEVFPKLQDPKLNAELMRISKFPFEKTDDHEFADALVAMQYPEIRNILEQMGITGDVAPLVDESHRPGRYMWDDEKKQHETLRKHIKKIITLRKYLGQKANEPVSDWDTYTEYLAKLFGTSKVLRVKNTGGFQSVKSVTARLPIEQLFVSNQIHSAIAEEVEQDKHKNVQTLISEVTEEGEDWSGLNDF